jgi:hypothetical protein
MSAPFNHLLSTIISTLSRELQSHGPLSAGEKRNLVRDVAQSLNPTWPFSNEGERLLAQFFDENKFPYVYADQDLETYCGTFYNKVTRPDFQVFIQQISSAFWIDAKYKTVYTSNDYRSLACIVETNLETAYAEGGIVGNVASAVIVPYKKYFMIDRSELVRLRNFQKISNSQVWLCLINKQDNPPVGHFWNTEKIWQYSFREKKEALRGKDREEHRYFEPLDPIELPYDWNIAPKVDLASGKSLACLFEPTEYELESHRDRLHKRGIWKR